MRLSPCHKPLEVMFWVSSLLQKYIFSANDDLFWDDVGPVKAPVKDGSSAGGISTLMQSDIALLDIAHRSWMVHLSIRGFKIARSKYNPSIQEIIAPVIKKDHCILPTEMGFEGSIRFLEDCPTLDQFKTVPVPQEFSQKVGIHPGVCCPEKRFGDLVCLPSDPWCPTYQIPQESDSDSDSDYEYYGEDYEYGKKEASKMAARSIIIKK